MNRRLNPQLFEEATNAVAEEESSYSAVVSQKVGSELKDMKKTVSRLESIVEILQSQVGQVTKGSETRTEAFSKALNEIEVSMAEQNQALQRRIQHIEEALLERKEIDQKTEAMVDRFNMSLQQFENRLATLQKVISDKEMALMSYRKIIEQIVDEVEKLKASRP